jgi:undecaprenyl-diphosphatase
MDNFFFFIFYSFAHQTSFFDQLVIFCARYLQYFAILAVFIYFFYHYVGEFNYKRPFDLLKTKIKEILMVFIPAVFSWIFAEILKTVIYHPRPFIFFQDAVQPLFIHGGVDSFPSGHAMFFGALAMSLYFIHKKMGRIYFLIALVIGLARIVAGIHFPLDIFAGYIFGFIITLIFELFFRKMREN